MKILFNLKSLNGKGGAEKALLALSKEMTRRGHSIDITVRDKDESNFAYPIPANVKVTCLGQARRYVSELVFSKHQSRFKAHVLINDYDVIVGWLRYGGAMVGWLPRNMKSVRIAAMRNLPYNLEPPTNKIFKLIRFYHRKVGLGRVDRIFVQMPQFVPLMPPNWQYKTTVIPNAALIPSSNNLVYADRPKIVIAVSRLVEQKRLDQLICGFGVFAREQPGWQLHIWGFGNPDFRASLQMVIDDQALGDSVKLMGVTNDIEGVYSQARIFAHPSRREGMSNAVTEAMAHSLPVIATADCEGMCELVRDGETGILISGSHGVEPLHLQIANALSSLAQDPVNADQLGQSARRHVMDRFSPDVIYDRWEKALMEAAKR